MSDNAVPSIPADRLQLMLLELGDLDWYVHRMARLLGVSMGTVRSMNIAKLRDRYGVTEPEA